MNKALAISLICIIFLAGCSAANVDDSPEEPVISMSTPLASTTPIASPTKIVLPTTLVPVASATVASDIVTSSAATAGAATPIVVTVIAGPTSPPLSEITPGPTASWAAPTPIPPLTSGSGPTTLKYQLLDQYPGHFYCDPDEYPVARGDEDKLAIDRFPQIQTNEEEFLAILSHLGLNVQRAYSNEEMLLIYREHKRLAAVLFEPAGVGYRFQFQIMEQDGQGFTLKGIIDGQGTIIDLVRTPGVLSCPICLASGTLIDTPTGPIVVEELRVGDVVWTVDGSGAREAVPILQAGRTIVPSSHQVIHLVLNDGRELWVSPGHPTADGRSLGELNVGDLLDGSQIISLERVQYEGIATYDILPVGATGYYWADGILLGSTLVAED